MSSKGSAHGQFTQACRNGNYPLAFTLARELAPLTLDDALSLVVLMAAKDPDRFGAAAVRWHGRLELERDIDLKQATLAMTALAALQGPHKTNALAVLRELI